MFPGLPSMYANPALMQQRMIQQAKAEKEARFQERRSHVIAHENAHAAAAGRFGGSPVIIEDRESGQVSGYVPIKMDFGKTADEALANARIIAGAALSPGDPSSQDKAVASSAMSIGTNLAATRRIQEQQQQEKPTLSNKHTGFTPPAYNPFAQPYGGNTR